MTKLEEAGTKGLIRAGLGPKLVILFYFHFLNMAIFLGVVGAAVLGILEVYLCYGFSFVMETFDGDFFFLYSTRFWLVSHLLVGNFGTCI